MKKIVIVLIFLCILSYTVSAVSPEDWAECYVYCMRPNRIGDPPDEIAKDIVFDFGFNQLLERASCWACTPYSIETCGLCLYEKMGVLDQYNNFWCASICEISSCSFGNNVKIGQFFTNPFEFAQSDPLNDTILLEACDNIYGSDFSEIQYHSNGSMCNRLPIFNPTKEISEGCCEYAISYPNTCWGEYNCNKGDPTDISDDLYFYKTATEACTDNGWNCQTADKTPVTYCQELDYDFGQCDNDLNLRTPESELLHNTYPNEPIFDISSDWCNMGYSPSRYYLELDKIKTGLNDLYCYNCLAKDGVSCGSNNDCYSDYCNPNGKCGSPNCNDDIQNQGETGIDCGGPCIACQQTECPDICNPNSPTKYRWYDGQPRLENGLCPLNHNKVEGDCCYLQEYCSYDSYCSSGSCIVDTDPPVSCDPFDARYCGPDMTFFIDDETSCMSCIQSSDGYTDGGYYSGDKEGTCENEPGTEGYNATQASKCYYKLNYFEWDCSASTDHSPYTHLCGYTCYDPQDYQCCASYQLCDKSKNQGCCYLGDDSYNENLYSCVDFNTDNNNCGTCRNKCAAGSICIDGSCQTPHSCSDNIQNGDETGIDCGGSCITVATEVCNNYDDDRDCLIDENPEADADCNDGLYCNGVETCQSGYCMSGNTIDCADNIGCTSDSCNEATDSCTHTADDSACPTDTVCADYSCDINQGCKVNFESSTTICRAKSGTCDLEERCTGVSSACPFDIKSPINTLCDDRLWCTTSDVCDGFGNCISSSQRDCSQNDLAEISTCDNIPDNNPFTYDFRDQFISTCNEASDSCTIGSNGITHTCDSANCGAECEINDDCADTDCDYLDGCIGNDYYDYGDIQNTCLADCSCTKNTCTSPTISYGDSRCIQNCMDNDNDGYNSNGGNCGSIDCNDNDASINPGAIEVYNGKDDNCDGNIDEGMDIECVFQREDCCGVNHGGTLQCMEKYQAEAHEQYLVESCSPMTVCLMVDNSLDYIGAYCEVNESACVMKFRDEDGDGFRDGIDCDDQNDQVFPGATEQCNGVDDNCDFLIDENLFRTTTCGVGICSGNTGQETCESGIWQASNCDPFDNAEDEICDDGLDNDCDGDIDAIDEDCLIIIPTKISLTPAVDGYCYNWDSLSDTDGCDYCSASSQYIIWGASSRNNIRGNLEFNIAQLQGKDIINASLVFEYYYKYGEIKNTYIDHYIGDGSLDYLECNDKEWNLDYALDSGFYLLEQDSSRGIYNIDITNQLRDDIVNDRGYSSYRIHWTEEDETEVMGIGTTSYNLLKSTEATSGQNPLLVVWYNSGPLPCTDNDNDGYNIGTGNCGEIDCNDNDESINPAATELCNNLDDDCDSVIDEDLTRTTTCGVGICSGNTGQETCESGIWQANSCDPFYNAEDEICDDGLDNDCDGAIDTIDLDCSQATTIVLQDPDTENLGDVHRYYLSSATGSKSRLATGNIQILSPSRWFKAYNKYNILSLPESANIVEAKLCWFHYREFEGEKMDRNVSVYQFDNYDWDEDMLCETDGGGEGYCPDFGEKIDSVNLNSYTANQPYWICWDVTSWASSVYDMGYNNVSFGLMEEPDSNITYRWWYSKEHSDAAKRPYLKITYMDTQSPDSNSTSEPEKIDLTPAVDGYCYNWEGLNDTDGCDSCSSKSGYLIHGASATNNLRSNIEFDITALQNKEIINATLILDYYLRGSVRKDTYIDHYIGDGSLTSNSCNIEEWNLNYALDPSFAMIVSPEDPTGIYTLDITDKLNDDILNNRDYSSYRIHWTEEDERTVMEIGAFSYNRFRSTESISGQKPLLVVWYMG